MEFIGILKVLRRWIWLLFIIIIPAPVLIFISLVNLAPIYSAETTIEITTPDLEDVSVFYERNFISNRDQTTITLNKFMEVARLSEVRNRTQEELNIDENYALDLSSELGADFVIIEITASTPELAETIANTHSTKSIEYFGELRAQPLDKSLIYFEEQVKLAKQELADAEQLLSDFQAENGITSIGNELDLQNTILERLLLNQAQLRFEALISPDDNLITDTETTTETISEYRQNLNDIIHLEAAYNALVNTIAIAKDKHDRLTENYTESQLKASFAKRAFFIQIINPATLPLSSDNEVFKPTLFGTIIAVVVAILLTFLLEYIFPHKSRTLE